MTATRALARAALLLALLSPWLALCGRPCPWLRGRREPPPAAEAAPPSLPEPAGVRRQTWPYYAPEEVTRGD